MMTRNCIETGKIGKRGVFTIPAPMRKRYGMADGSLVIAEEQSNGILLRPAIATPIETYSDERTAEFLLTNTADLAEYEAARREVKAMGVDPDRIPHIKPVK
jgi:bifunctional DNA-binding transcriptional regulator/antitoxin component of YhaV-PrlF toxin-antitoxin module